MLHVLSLCAASSQPGWNVVAIVSSMSDEVALCGCACYVGVRMINYKSSVCVSNVWQGVWTDEG